MVPEARYAQQACQKCEAADAVCAVYRHALKDIVRGLPSAAQNTAIAALDNDKVHYLGRLYHKMVKAGMILTKHWTDQESTDFKTAVLELHNATEELMKNPGATVKGWMGAK